MPFSHRRRQPFEAQLLPVLDATSEFDPLWGDISITHPLGPAYLGLYKNEMERIRNASDEISNLSSHISLVDGSLPRKMASVLSMQDDTDISFFEIGGLTLSPSSWFKSLKKRHRPRSASHMQPALERLYSPTFKYHFSNTTETTWRTNDVYNNASIGTIGSTSGIFEPSTHLPFDNKSPSPISDRRPSPSSSANEGLSSRSSMSPVSVDLTEPDTLPVNLIETYRKLVTVADKSQSHSVQIREEFDSSDGKIIAVTPTCSIFTTEDEIVSDDDGPRHYEFASIDSAMSMSGSSRIRPKSPTIKRSSSAQRRARKPLVIDTSRSLSSLTVVKTPLLSSKSVRFNIPDSNCTPRTSHIETEDVIPISFVPYGYVPTKAIESRTEDIFRNPWLEPNTPMSAREASRLPSLPPTPNASPPTPGILRQNRSRHPSLAVTGIMRAPLTSVNTPGVEHVRDAHANRTQTIEVLPGVDVGNTLPNIKHATLQGLPGRVAPPSTERSVTAPTLKAKHSFDPQAVGVNDKAMRPFRSKSLSDIPTYSTTASDKLRWHYESGDHTTMENFANGPKFI